MTTWKLGAMLALLGLVSVLVGFKPYDNDPYLVEVVVYDDSTNPIQVMEIWSDHTTGVRDLHPNERPNMKCGPHGHCTNDTLHCSVLPRPIAGRACMFCVSATAPHNGTFCWPVEAIVCSTDQSEYTCGTKSESTCVTLGVGAGFACRGLITPIGTPCKLYGCV